MSLHYLKKLISFIFINCIWCQNITIAVFDFENNGLEDNEVRQLLTRLESELVKLGDFKVVERRNWERFRRTKVANSGITEQTIIDVGNILSANQIILGSVGSIGGLYTISAKLVDVKSEITNFRFWCWRRSSWVASNRVGRGYELAGFQ